MDVMTSFLRTTLLFVYPLLVAADLERSALGQNVPQVTGWTFSRSSGLGMSRTTSVTTSSDSNRLGESDQLVNVVPVERIDPDAAYRIVDPELPFALGVANRTTQGAIRAQNLDYFTLRDWGFSVFSY